MYHNGEHEKVVINRGDKYAYIGSYHCGEKTLDGKCNKTASYIRIKCPYCGNEYDVRLSGFKNGDKCNKCCNEYENSFAYYIQVELGEGLNKYWDWNNNELNPYYIYKKSSKKVNIKCDKADYHSNYSVIPYDFTKGNRCPYCTTRRGKVHPKDSFGRWLINTYGEDAIEKYWSPRNILNPFKISLQSNKKVWMLCQEKDYHNDNGGYETTLDNFYKGKRCPYCCNHHGKVHKLDSFGSLYPDKAKYWSKNNKKSPFEVTSRSGNKYKFTCEKCGEEFERQLDNLNRSNTGVICRECSASFLEQSTKEILDEYKIKYYREYIFDGLMGIKDGLLRFDFYLPNHNILIECQGEQHEIWKETFQTKKQFETQQEHDRRKKEYAKQHNIRLLEIWYYDIDNIENILMEELNLKNN